MLVPSSISALSDQTTIIFSWIITWLSANFSFLSDLSITPITHSHAAILSSFSKINQICTFTCDFLCRFNTAWLIRHTKLSRTWPLHLLTMLGHGHAIKYTQHYLVNANTINPLWGISFRSRGLLQGERLKYEREFVRQIVSVWKEEWTVGEIE